MNDEQIRQYLQSRGQATPPLDLAGSIVDAVERSQERRSWFAPFVPAVAAVGLAAAVLLVAALVTGPMDDVGPNPTPESTPSATPTLSATPAVEGLLEPGDRITLAAVDAVGPWGTITLERGADTGGYAEEPIDEDSFVIEIFVDYEADRWPEPQEFGETDWTLTTPDGSGVGTLLESSGPPVVPERPRLGQHPGAVDIMSTPTEGWLLFVVARELADEELQLIYRPSGFDAAVTNVPVRVPGEPPPPVPAATPAPTPDEAGYVQREGMPFSVLDSEEADALFDEPDSCTNPEAGYTVTFPEDWYTNTQFGDVPACSWFSPTDYEAGDPSEVPDEIVIVIDVLVGGSRGFFQEPDYTINEEVTVDGFVARRTEQIGATTPGGQYESQTAEYLYSLVLGPAPEEGPNVYVSTLDEEGKDYELNKAVLDRIMASMEIDE